MVGGFNTNIKYRGRKFHVQTEDGGEANPQVVTLLYEGGAILSVNKQRYEKELADAGHESSVRALMEEQHKDLVQGLKSGALDGVLGISSGAAAAKAKASKSAATTEFGEGIISDASLGDVILSHLAAD